MSDRAQMVLDALMEYDADEGVGYPIYSIHHFFDKCYNGNEYDDDYENLTIDEEKQVIQKFLEFAY